MIMDKLAEFADAVALNTGAANTYVVGDTIDANLARDLGQGQPLYLVITVATAVNSAGNGVTIDFQLRSHTATPITTAAKLHASTGAQAQATLVAGKFFVIPLPMGEEYNRYLGITQVTGVEAATAGAFNAFLTLDPHGWKAYPEGDN